MHCMCSSVQLVEPAADGRLEHLGRLDARYRPERRDPARVNRALERELHSLALAAEGTLGAKRTLDHDEVLFNLKLQERQMTIQERHMTLQERCLTLREKALALQTTQNL